MVVTTLLPLRDASLPRVDLLQLEERVLLEELLGTVGSLSGEQRCPSNLRTMLRLRRPSLREIADRFAPLCLMVLEAASCAELTLGVHGDGAPAEVAAWRA